MQARVPKVPMIKLVRPMTTLVARKMMEVSTKKPMMLQKAQAIYQMAIVTQMLRTAISMRTLSFSTLTL
jgi:hypothetical protein